VLQVRSHPLQPGIRSPPDEPDIETAVTDLARIAGFRPSKRQPLPGMEKLWKGMMYLMHSVEYHLELMELMDAGILDVKLKFS